MARLITCGFELRNQIECGLLREGAQASGWSFTGTPRIAGGNGVCATSSLVFNGGQRRLMLPFPASGEFYCRFAWKGTSNPAVSGGGIGDLGWFLIRDSAGSYHVKITGTPSSGNTMTVVDSTGGTFGTFTMPIVGGNWGMCEVYFKLDPSAGEITIKIDSAVVFTFSGNTNPGLLANNPSLIGWDHRQNSSSTATVNIDDVGINDTSGSEQNSWLGEGVIVAILPNGDGSTNQWTGSDGNSASNYLLVDENPNNGDTDYVGAGNAALVDEYNLASLPALPAGATITLVMPVVIAKRQDPATTTNIDLGVDSNGTQQFSTGVPVTTAYSYLAGDPVFLDPDGAIDWTETKVNALQFAMRSS